jgi:hypothetical protein
MDNGIRNVGRRLFYQRSRADSLPGPTLQSVLQSINKNHGAGDPILVSRYRAIPLLCVFA